MGSFRFMKAMILAAGLGTRMRPVTDTIPKALVVVNGKPLLQHALEHVRRYGIRDVIINVHHFPGQILDFLRVNADFGMKISISDESEELLETGGGVMKAAWFFEEGSPFLVRNVDVISDLDIDKMCRYHEVMRPVGTLAVRRRESSRYLLFDDRMQLSGWEDRKTGRRRIIREAGSLIPYAFNGIQILDPELFSLINETGKFSLTDLYLRLGATHRICGFTDQGDQWYSASSPAVPER